jgi:ABC-type uncharacterized transport system ATPase subunit
VAILRKGRCIVDGPVAAVLASAGPAPLRVKVDDLDAGLAVLQRAHLSVQRDDGHLSVAVPPERAGDISRLLGEHHLWVTELRQEDRNLEELFLELTLDDEREEVGTW